MTQEQREAYVSDEVNTLVLAGAGLGKTSVMIARLGYLLKSGLAKPQEVMDACF
ncbi:UvrD-helicase domain-containing protein [Candidatus Enterovibrio altilux]|uniref:UvrD-helicase domain-containing protein n=1 Tax=Candidatus Enterovibrio altilux TaxID=1927128 RepID=UPI00167FFE76|nr:UvrD-helicase domain-containing protein [Candidatus Enterovibrio luxaltus]